MGFIFHKTAVVTVVVITLVLFSVIPATVIDENIKHEDAKTAKSEASKDVKESAVDQTWKEKVTEGLGLQTEDAKDDTTVDFTKDEITDKASEVAGSAKDTSYESAQTAKDTSYGSAQSAKDGAEYVMDAAYEATKDSAGYVQDSAYKTAESAKEGAGYVKDATYGKTQLDAKEGTTKKGKEGGDENTLEWAKEKAKQGYEQAKNVILGSRSYEEAEL